jgi:hypothetical protein
VTGSAREKDTALALTHAGVRGTAERAAAGRAGLAVRSPRSDAGTVRLTGRDVAGLVLVGEMPYAPHQSPPGRCDSRRGVRGPRAGGLGCLACRRWKVARAALPGGRRRGLAQARSRWRGAVAG